LLAHLTQSQLEDYLRQRLSGAELLNLSDHLALCAPCRQQVAHVSSDDTAFMALHAELFFSEEETIFSPEKYGHPAFEEIANYVEGKQVGEDPHSVKDHLAVCQQCSLAVEDLRAFRNEVAPNLDREYRPDSIPVTTERRQRRLPSFLPGSWWRPRLAFGFALAVLLLSLTGWLIWRAQRKTEESRTEVTVVAPTTQATTADGPSVTAVDSPGPESEAEAIAELNDGESRVRLDRDGNLSGVDNLPPAYQRKIKQALRTQHIERSVMLSGLNRPESALMTSDEHANEFSVSEPIGKVTLSDRPTFQWTQLEGASAYVIEIYDENFNLVTASAPLTAATWTAVQPLRRGGIYSWQVKATKAGQEFRAPRPPARQAKFRVLDGDRAEELAKAQRAYASSHLTMGLLYADAGLLDQAEREFRALQRANPQSAVAKKLLGQVQGLRK
jgi:anti-sigma factor RsiW